MIAEILESFGRAKKCLKIYGSIRIESMRASSKSMENDYLRYNSSSSIDNLSGLSRRPCGRMVGGVKEDSEGLGFF